MTPRRASSAAASLADDLGAITRMAALAGGASRAALVIFSGEGAAAVDFVYSCTRGGVSEDIPEHMLRHIRAELAGEVCPRLIRAVPGASSNMRGLKRWASAYFAGFALRGEGRGALILSGGKPLKSQGQGESLLALAGQAGRLLELTTRAQHAEESRAATERERVEAERRLRESEEQLRQSQKMEAVGRLAGGIAHDFNNLLTAINGYSDLLLRTLADDRPRREKVAEIRRAGERASGLTRQLLAFSRKQVLQPKLLDLNAIISGLEVMLRRVIGEDVALHTNLAPDLAGVEADPGQVEQMLVNLAVNARDAMPGGGCLSIETRNVRLDADYARRHVSVRPGDYVMIAISDDGVGMSPETRDRVFEPFFTTKEAGKGTGLGLSTVYGIVKQSGGNVWTYSEEGMGTVFKIYLPSVAAGGAGDAEEHADEGLARGEETVLLVEDDSTVRELAAEVLRAGGYRVITAPHGEGGLDLCREYEGEIDLVLTDVVMPRLGGRAMVGRLAEARRRELPVIYMSGYTDDAVVRHGILAADVNFIQKPFTPDALTRKVRAVLDARREGVASKRVA